jgi:hypothetical protein
MKQERGEWKGNRGRERSIQERIRRLFQKVTIDN